MFAVIKTGGKQYKVAKNDIVKVEKLSAKAGDKITLSDVLMLGTTEGDGSDVVVGTPLIEGASVAAEVIEQTRTDKIIVFKKKRRHNYRRKKGHRQELTILKILDIKAKGAKKAAKGTAKTVDKADKADKAADAAPKKAASKKKPTAQKGAKKTAPKAASKTAPKASESKDS